MVEKPQLHRLSCTLRNIDKLGRAMERARSSGEAMARRLLAVVNCAILVDSQGVSGLHSESERQRRGGPHLPMGSVMVPAGCLSPLERRKLGLGYRRRTGSAGHPSVAHQLLHRDNCWGSRGDGVAPLCMSSPCQGHRAHVDHDGPPVASACRWSPVSGQMEPATQMAATIPIRRAIRRLLFLWSGACACWDASGDGSTKRSSIMFVGAWSIAECLGGWGGR
ncbi:hypothetical protein F5144DRAFT_593310 [Chaetomium tenue]|uniref:Uncharacterized protein n=1 Tax=Chaetomium tenue TaxID=1854479 RepID=A0ACB7PAU6_9PEZI|nr:hypothetical protein F5144DRAFT_593310 [Chaetomium globosum]